MPGPKVDWTRHDIMRYRLPALNQPLPTFLAKPVKHAYQALGNGIAPPTCTVCAVPLASCPADASRGFEIHSIAGAIFVRAATSIQSAAASRQLCMVHWTSTRMPGVEVVVAILHGTTVMEGR